MQPSMRIEALPHLFLHADHAQDMMTPNPVSLREDATMPEAVALLTQRGFSAAPVIDEAGRPIGVLSQVDILVHEQRGGSAEGMRVRDVMTPVVYSVALDTSAASVVEQMVALRVRRLFVVDSDSVLVGVISAYDILRRLHA
jgi:CBS domain-containing protein